MNKHAIVLSALLLGAVGPAVAQQQTEIYIPIGESPGLSGTATDVGEIRGFDAGTGMLSIAADGVTRSVRITDDTAIWVDRTAAERANSAGDGSDLVAGRLAEVRYADPASRRTAAWVKVRVAN